MLFLLFVGSVRTSGLEFRTEFRRLNISRGALNMGDLCRANFSSLCSSGPPPLGQVRCNCIHFLRRLHQCVVVALICAASPLLALLSCRGCSIVPMDTKFFDSLGAKLSVKAAFREFVSNARAVR